MHPDHDSIVQDTQRWLTQAVIGLNLCPFAKAVHIKNQIRYHVSQATSVEGLLEDLVQELIRLRDADPEEIETTLLVHPDVLRDFLDFNDFLDAVDAAIDELDLEGVIQVASFHPDYEFGDEEPGDITHYTNRSPYPTLHLLHESSLEKAVDAFPDAADIFEVNKDTMRRLGDEGWQALWKE